MGFEDEYSKGKKRRDPLANFIPALGLIMAIAIGAIAWIVKKPVHDFLIEQIDTFPTEQRVEYVIAGVIFLTVMLIVGLIYALAAPKPEKHVTESELKKEKAARQQEGIERKRRKRQIRQQALKERKARREEQQRRR